MREPLLITAAILTLALLAFVLYALLKKSRPIRRIYKEAVQLENNKAYQEAIELYELILEQSNRLAIKDRNFIALVIQRIKTLQASVNFEKRFTEKETSVLSFTADAPTTSRSFA